MLDAMAYYLQINSVGTVGTDIYKHRLPSQPDRALALIEYGGAPPMYSHAATSPEIEDRRVQIMARDSYPVLEDWANEAADTLQQLVNQTVNGVRFVEVSALQLPFDGGEDDNGRPVRLCNLAVQIAR